QRVTAVRGHGIVGIVDEPVGVLVPRRLWAQRAVAGCAMGPSTTVQVVRRIARPRERPLALVPPAVLAHDEDLHGWLVEEAGVDPLEPVIEPSELGLVQIDERRRSEVDVARAG